MSDEHRPTRTDPSFGRSDPQAIIVDELIVCEPDFGLKREDVADAILGMFEQAGFRVVSADAVVLNRDDIPRDLPHILQHFAERRWVQCEMPNDQELEAAALAARLLSGGSPAAPEDGTDG